MPRGGGGQSGARDPAIAQEVLKRFGVDIDSSDNGIALSKAFHRPIHSGAYYGMLNSQLSEAQSKEEVLKVLARIKQNFTIRMLGLKCHEGIMKIFLLEGDMDYVVACCKDKHQRRRIFDVEFEGTRLSPNEVVPMRIFPHEPVAEGVLTDFPDTEDHGTLVLSAKAADVLLPMLTACGELFPVESDEAEGYSLFMCYRFVDALDVSQSDFTRYSEGGGIWDVRRYELHKEMLAGVDIFHMIHRRRRLFVSDRFVDVVERHGLTGLLLKPVWSDTEGGLVIDKPSDPFEQYWRKDEEAVKRAKRQAMRYMIARRLNENFNPCR